MGTQKQEVHMEQYFNEKQAAKFLGTSPATIRRMMKSGRLPTRYVGHSPKFKLSELEATLRDKPFLPGEVEER